MNYKSIYKTLVSSMALMTPILSFAQTENIKSDSNLGFYILLGVSATVILAAFITLVNLGFNLLNIEKEKYGITDKAVEKSTSIWHRLNNRLTNIVPIEQEKTILLDHDYDGIQELDNDLPPWWLWGFYISIVFGIFYIGYYHFSDRSLNQVEEYEYEIAQAKIASANFLEKQANNINESNINALTDVEDLKSGQEIFLTNCTTCHLKDGGGANGPNLTDQYWKHGGDIRSVFKTIKYGVPEKGMIAWKAKLSAYDMHKVASYVMTLQGTTPAVSKEPEGELYVPEPVENDN